ncbi:acyltransferase family protein [Bacillaceae bacterium Marseille-Q3522]|nr:acyltransferase family protein [Bacillaceae bacterium Marseille-Q3522]
MNNKGIVNEVFWLRAIACLVVTFGHALQNGYHYFTEITIYHNLAYLLYMGVLFGVPVFVFLSEFLLSYKYAETVPKGFMKKRFKVLLPPYLCMSTVYALFRIDEWTILNVLSEVGKNIFFGYSTIYFILIIFQFYLLHMAARKYLNRLPAKIVIPVAFVINIGYLSIFNFSEAPQHPLAIYLWNPGYWMPFFGWLFYFVLGFYCGKHYKTVLQQLHRYRILVYVFPIFTFSGVLLMNKIFMLTQDSKRVDMLLFATSVIFLLMYVASRMKITPGIVLLISNYSFSIFLLNEMFFILLLQIKPPAFFNMMTYSLVAFLITIIGSIMLSYLLNLFPFGKYIAGKIMPFRKEKRSLAEQRYLRKVNG